MDRWIEKEKEREKERKRERVGLIEKSKDW